MNRQLQHKSTFSFKLGAVIVSLLTLLLWAAPAMASEVDGCYFDQSKLPDDAVVWVGQTFVRGFPLPGGELTPDELAGKPVEIDVVINNPDQPVILYLHTFYRIHWNFRWTPGTKIEAVLLAGGDVKAVGLPDDVPVVYADLKHPECRKYADSIGRDTGSLWRINRTSLAVIGRKPQKFFPWGRQRLVMGEEDYDPSILISADARLQQKLLPPIPPVEPYKAQTKYDISIRPEDDPERLEKQTDDLKESLRKKHLRVVSRATMEAWVEGHIDLLKIQNLADEETCFTGQNLADVNGYEVVSTDFRLADVCMAKSKYHLFFPEGIKVTTSFFPTDFNIGKCSLYFGRSGYRIYDGRFIKLWQLDNLGTMIITGSLPGKKWGIVLIK